jgi:tRNA dimethylallyltransferase
MIENGLLIEVKGLLDKGYSPDLPALSAIGYREMAAVLKGELTMDQAVLRMKKLTHQFVRRQANWFKESDPDIHWIAYGENSVTTAVDIIQHRENWHKKAE